MIIDLQRRLAEVGRIRIGQQVSTNNGRSRPAKLDTFRLTSPDKQRIVSAAKLYGGTPQPWEAPAGQQWEVVTQTDTLPVIVPPSEMAFSQYYELWSAGGCQRRCDGQTESISDGPCQCDPDKRECNIHTRLSIMLRDLPGLGVWRLDTQGYYAAVEIQGAVEVVQMAAGHGHMLPAALRLEQRMVKRTGEGTRRFAVPVLDIEVSPAQLLGGAQPIMVEQGTGRVLDEPGPRQINGGTLTPVPDTVPERPTASVAEQAVTTKERKPRRNAAQPIPSTGLAPRTAAQAAVAVTEPPVAVEVVHEEPAEEEPPPDDDSITSAQLKKLAILLREGGFDDRDTKLSFCVAAINRDITSSKELTKGEAHKLIDILENTDGA